MFTAMNENGKVLYLWKLSRKEREQLTTSKWFCPDCGTPLIFKNGVVKVPHFSHVSVTNCPYNHEPESLLHLTGKLHLYDALQKDTTVNMEYKFPSISQRADIYLPDSRVAVEFQCSPISPGNFSARKNGYSSLGIHSFWLIGGKPSIRTFFPFIIVTMTASQQLMIDYHPVYKWHAMYYDIESKRLFILHHLQLLSPTKFLATIHYYPQATIQINHFLQPDLLPGQAISLTRWLESRDHWLINKMTYTKNRQDPLLSSLYVNGVVPSYLPSFIGLPNDLQCLFLCHPVEWQWYVWSAGFESTELVTLDYLQYVLEQKTVQGAFRKSAMYEYFKEAVKEMIVQYLDQLIKLGVVISLDDTTYQRSPKYNSHHVMEKKIEREQLLLRAKEEGVGTYF